MVMRAGAERSANRQLRRPAPSMGLSRGPERTICRGAAQQRRWRPDLAPPGPRRSLGRTSALAIFGEPGQDDRPRRVVEVRNEGQGQESLSRARFRRRRVLVERREDRVHALALEAAVVALLLL